MKGKHRIKIKSREVCYVIDVKRKYTIINDETGTGKTLLLDLIQDYRSGRLDGDIESEYPVFISMDLDILELLNNYNKGFVFIDEAEYLLHPRFDEITKKSGLYYIIFSRYPLTSITYSIDEVYEFKKVYKGRSRFIMLEKYFDFKERLEFKPKFLYTEDEGSGFQFYDKTLSNCDVISTHGRSGIGDTVLQDICSYDRENILLIADGSACGGNSDDILAIKHECEKRSIKLNIFLPESFEYILLSSKLFNGAGIDAELERTYDFVESSEVLSWEQYYEGIIKDLVGEGKFIDIKRSYKKGSLPNFFIRNSKVIYETIRNLIPTSRRYL